MRTLHVGLRVADLDRALAFYGAVGYEVVGEVPETELGHLVMLKLPADEFVTIELVCDPSATTARTDGRLSHLVVQVESMDAVLAQLSAASTPTRRRPLTVPRTSGRPGSSIPTETESSWSSGRAVTPSA